MLNSNVSEEIRKAAKDRKTLKILYKDSKGNVTQREGEPYETKNDGLYLFCYSKNQIRFFKLDNIMSAEVTTKTFSPKFPIRIE